MWCRNMEKILTHKYHATKRIGRVADEYALAYTLQKMGGMGDAKWSCGLDRVDATTIGIHFPRHAYLGNPLFLTALKEAMDDKFLGLHKLRPSALDQHDSWAIAEKAKLQRKKRVQAVKALRARRRIGGQ